MRTAFWRRSLMLVVPLLLIGEAAPAVVALGSGGAGGSSSSSTRRSFGTVTGSVRDGRGKPLAGALVSLLRDGASEIVKQTKSAADGSFTARVAPGRYLLRAVAMGFDPVTFSAVQVTSSAELVYRFNLQPAGEGRTVTERRRDRDDRKWDIRAAQHSRSIFQINEGENELAGASAPAPAADDNDTAIPTVAEDSAEAGAASRPRMRPHGVVESFYAVSAADAFRPNYAGLNFAVAGSVNDRLDLILAGQFGEFERLETTARVRVGARHRLSTTVGAIHLSPKTQFAGVTPAHDLGQFSVRAIDEWIVRDGVVVVFGLDYSRYLGGGARAVSPRLGLQFDMNARTRVKAAYAPGGTSSRVQSVALFEGGPVHFREEMDYPVAVVDGQAVMERSRRLEFGVERVLGNRSTVEATAFFDTTDGRGVGLLSTPHNAFATENGAALLNIASQQGAARGMRVVYMRRISRMLKASAGYSFGRGQQLASAEANAAPDQLFQSGFFQTAAAQVDADVLEGTRVRTVLRFSPSAAVFAIDPFAGQLAVYDPSLSILVTQELPNFGLPVRAEAVLDARNILDVMTSVEDGEKSLSIGTMRRMVRGGISVRF